MLKDALHSSLKSVDSVSYLGSVDITDNFIIVGNYVTLEVAHSPISDFGSMAPGEACCSEVEDCSFDYTEQDDRHCSEASIDTSTDSIKTTCEHYLINASIAVNNHSGHKPFAHVRPLSPLEPLSHIATHD